jgi:hypothetical protein
MGELGALFNPGMRHELEERQAKAARREEEGNARDGDLRIDLESGVAVINVVPPTEPGSTESASGAAGAAGDADSSPSAASAGSTAKESTADSSAASATAAPTESAEGQAEPEKQQPALRPRGKRGMSASHR